MHSCAVARAAGADRCRMAIPCGVSGRPRGKTPLVSNQKKLQEYRGGPLGSGNHVTVFRKTPDAPRGNHETRVSDPNLTPRSPASPLRTANRESRCRGTSALQAKTTPGVSPSAVKSRCVLPPPHPARCSAAVPRRRLLVGCLAPMPGPERLAPAGPGAFGPGDTRSY